MTLSGTTLSGQQASDGAPGWRLLLGRLHLTAGFASFSEALEFVAEVGRIAEHLDHHPEVDLRRSLAEDAAQAPFRVHLAVSSHDVGGLTMRDLRLARTVTELVQRWDAVVLHHQLLDTEVGIDALDVEAVLPFWQAVTGYRRVDERNLGDPDRIGPGIWFQQMDQPRPGRNRVHLDLNVAHDEAPQRVARALAAGGRLVSDEHAPSWWVLCDPEGNEACVCTWQARD